MFKFSALAALVAILPAFVEAQSQLYGQCGGIGWSGATTCVSGATCTVLNDYYSQCLPGSAASTTVVTSKPASTVSATPTSSGPVSSPSSAPIAGNPFEGFEIYLSPYYAAEVTAAAQVMSSSSSRALEIAQVPTFTWFDAVAKVPDLGTYLADAQSLQTSSGKKYIVQIVVYDLPDRDCAALASNGEFSIADDGLNKYENYIDQLVAQIKQFPDVRVVAVIEPDSLANLVTNLSVSKCSNAQTAYKAGVTYAMQQLNSVGVYMYLDAGHAGWLGWPANLSPAAQLFNSLYTSAGSPQFVRGLATDVANYNALSAASPDPITSGNPNYDEIHYINALAPLLTAMPAHFIVDQGRSGKQNIRTAWGDWCNVKGAGFGTRPTTNTGSSLIDSIVWVKPGGECDGTSNTSSPRYDAHCGQSDAASNAPEAGTWFQAYFEALVSNATPAL
ncbi:cellobiohydrolaseII [Armillaria novae-zelandiae]|uniref:Glucanase n=1 Tax=Armillaria novae-zelandiae TaxID=153914 RepID=A0AA39TDY3_9AGAR|nr:cellobiohydrolaseII [Armillaria novae-zelandiae]